MNKQIYCITRAVANHNHRSSRFEEPDQGDFCERKSFILSCYMFYFHSILYILVGYASERTSLINVLYADRHCSVYPQNVI